MKWLGRIFVLQLLAISFCTASDFLKDNLKVLNWNGVEVVWLEDNTFPVFDVVFYYNSGALSDRKGRAGETQMMFDLLLLNGTHTLNGMGPSISEGSWTSSCPPVNNCSFTK